MNQVTMAWGRGLACVLTLACLAACNSSDDSATNPSSPPTGNGTPPAAPQPQSTNVAPKILGTPSAEVVVGQAYSFKPTATDADGDNLTFAISGKPSWASFNTATGKLAGTPAAADVGSHEEITISVSDGQSTTNLAQFAINVVQQSNGSVSLAWAAPTENTDGSTLTNLEGYKIHYGTQSHNYSTTVTLENAGITRYVIENLAPGKYYFAISAVSASGAESDLSGEASKVL